MHAHAGHSRGSEVGQRLDGHARAEVGAADADVHHVGDGFAREAEHGARVEGLGKVAHPRQFALHVGLHRVAPGAGVQRVTAQCHVQHGAVFGGVDGVATEHGVALSRHVGLFGQREQRLLDGGCKALAAGVERDAGGARRHAVLAVRVGEQLAQVRRGAGGERLQLLPGGQGGGQFHGWGFPFSCAQ